MAAEGGTIETGETPDGGFRVTVHLPLTPGDAVSSPSGESLVEDADSADSVVTRQQPLRAGHVPAASTGPPAGEEG